MILTIVFHLIVDFFLKMKFNKEYFLGEVREGRGYGGRGGISIVK